METPSPSSRPPKLLDQLRARLRMLHDSIRTEEAYVGWARRSILFHGKRHPADTGIPVTTLSEILTGKRGISPKVRTALAGRFKVAPALFV